MTIRKFLNTDPSMPGAIILETDNDKDGGITTMYLRIGDCRKTIELTFELKDYSLKGSKYKFSKKACNKSLRKAKILRDFSQKVIDSIEEEIEKHK